ncbi:serrate RNA effector molecule homolog isoform X3 [Syngnathoides biaculeatus]|nr:serrate RNA effector molecule homolog isoform X3 [Syngnathoides biaculeatus]XP_061664649.1 serrate RNA effector molecule homolog isoform X3 [Syngnathoides biaculeatus]XP_061664650.1 serrate RNA effector molecule homolog isoform X3 [Syngnathoides biaculeatus]XP_061664651.1 serrate RNA effector molecule homolog isoform X3 [Syngnathoides biaculeatus]XP_061664652.1 serrate RNA effector molecule homolog isoform X3 [Syngnathoides biaculeatus]
MGDSDDEFDRRRRDKFRRERSDMERSREREERRRDDWPDRDWERGRERRRDYDRGRRERFSPPRHMSPQHKRMRRDWDDHRGEPYRFEQPFGGGGGGGGGALFPRVGPQGWPPDIPQVPMHHGAHPLQGRLAMVDPDLPPPGPPTMRSFKDFLLNTEDSVDETEAVKRYNQYKLDFRRQQLQDFFVQHKNQEWFRSKYHPDDIATRKAESLAALKRRLGVFLFLWDNKWLDGVALDMEHATAIIKVLDAAVIKMEGGTDLDLKVLEPGREQAGGEESAAGPSKEPERTRSQVGVPCWVLLSVFGSRKAPLYLINGGSAVEVNDDDFTPLKDEESKQNGEDEEDEEEEEEDKEEEKERKEEEEEPKKSRKRKRSMSADSGEGSASDSSRSDGEKEEKAPASPVRPRPLHLTTSLFIRSVPPDASKEEIAALCRRYSGFLRVALSEPQPERRFFRRCWLTFDRGVNIKETCWNLQNIRLRDCELSPVVNRDLCRRVRSVNGLTQHKPVARNDVRLAARLVHALDQRAELWQEQTETNPVLKNITDYLIEEVSAEEEELMGGEAGDVKDAVSSDVSVETDKTLLKVLDTLLLYLRVVHSLDYYNFCQYPTEDHMPHRCGLIHVRGPLPVAKITAAEVSEHLKMCEERLAPLLSPPEALSADDAVRLGKKDPEQEVEKFLAANTQELSKDKWLCPLSGKKFKAPEFVRKHILNKHSEKVDAVRQEVDYFNNYLMDAKRPVLPENKPPPPPAQAPPASFPAQSPQPQSLLGYPPGIRPLLPAFPGAPHFPANQFGAGRGHYDSFRGNLGFPAKQPNNRGMRGDPRSIIEYRDLDAPDDLDFF